jgi:hypothetical protein
MDRPPQLADSVPNNFTVNSRFFCPFGDDHYLPSHRDRHDKAIAIMLRIRPMKDRMAQRRALAADSADRAEASADLSEASADRFATSAVVKIACDHLNRLTVPHLPHLTISDVLRCASVSGIVA